MILDPALLPHFQRRVFETAMRIAEGEQREVFLVGGAVRDLLLGRSTRDLDFTLLTDSAGFASRLAGQLDGEVTSFPLFRTYKIEFPEEHVVDITTARSESYSVPGSLPVVADGTLRQDLERRDFSVNAIAFGLHDRSLTDSTGGQQDLRAGVLRVLHNRSFIDDPTRMHRGVRLASRLGFSLDPHTLELLEATVKQGGLKTVTGHRIWREVQLAFEEEHPIQALRALSRHGLLPFDLCPEEVTDATIEQLAAANPGERDLMLAGYLAAADPGKSRTFEGWDWTLRRKKELQRILELKSTASEQLAARTTVEQQFHFLEKLPPVLVRIMSVTAPSHAERIRRYLRASEAMIAFPPGVVPGGPHIGRAIFETRQALFGGHITEQEATRFATEAAIRYFSQEGGA